MSHNLHLSLQSIKHAYGEAAQHTVLSWLTFSRKCRSTSAHCCKNDVLSQHLTHLGRNLKHLNLRSNLIKKLLK